MDYSGISTILERRSIRKYTDQKVTRDALTLILKAGRFAPSAQNCQAWHFTVVEDVAVIDRITETLKAAAEEDGTDGKLMAKVCNDAYSVNFGSAPAFIIISGDPGSAMPAENCALAAGNIMLTACALGLGSCWINQLSRGCLIPKFRALLTELGVPPEYNVYASVCLGYPDGAANASERRDGTVNYVNR
ncbi:NAD(P)H nitroreductase [Synergistales bacterium]|nr:NAD(P)H nitroreductase [Synergistales bacterium]